MKANQAAYRVRTLCRVLGISRSGYYAWRDREPSVRATADVQLLERVRTFHTKSRKSYGVPRIYKDLVDAKIHVGRKRIARLMRNAGLRGVSRRRTCRTTIRDRNAKPARDLVQRQFVAAQPNQLWVADITYVPTWAGWIYLAVVLDVFSRRIVGWAMTNHLRTELVLEALEMALLRRRPGRVIHHSDHGSQYTTVDFGKRCGKAGVRLSMGSVGDCFDNAMCESFFATLECELFHRHTFRTHSEARMAIFDFIEGWYNPHRRHSALDYVSPMRYENTRAATA